MAKQDEHRFNLRFDEDDENHRRVSAYLNQCGRKKARYIVKAVLAYWELQDGRIPVVEQPERKQLSETESAIHKIGEQKQHKVRKCRHFVNVDPKLEDRECQKEYKEQIHVFGNTDI